MKVPVNPPDRGSPSKLKILPMVSVYCVPGARKEAGRNVTKVSPPEKLNVPLTTPIVAVAFSPNVAAVTEHRLTKQKNHNKNKTKNTKKNKPNSNEKPTRSSC